MPQATKSASNGIIANWKSALLHLSIQYKFQKLTDYLIKHGCNVDSQDEFGKTPLLKATYKLQSQTVKILLSENADMLLPDLNGKNALQTALELPSILECMPIVQIFTSRVANICANNEEILTLLSAVKCPLSHIIYFQDASLTRAMLARGCKVNQRNPSDGNTALHVAVLLLDLENVKLLLQHGADRSATNNQGYMPFMSIFTSRKSTRTNGAEILSLVMPPNVDWTERDGEGKLKLYPIFVHSSPEFFRIFLKIYDNVDLDAKDARGKTPLHYLVERDRTDVYEILKTSPIDVDIRDNSGRTALHVAASRGNGDAVKFLLDKGADANLPHNGQGPIFLAFGREAKIAPRRTIALLLQNATREQLICGESTIYARIFDRYADDREAMGFSESVTAHLAMLEKLGRPSLPFDPSVPFYASSSTDALEPYFRRLWRNKIATVTKYYWAYKEQLEEMQRDVVCGSLTLFDVLTDDVSGGRVSRCAWSIERLERLQTEFCRQRFTFYYQFRLSMRFENAKKLACWRRRLAEILCECTRLFEPDHVCVEKIARQLGYDDLKMFD